MENHAKKLVCDDIGNFKSKSLNDLNNNNPINRLYTKNTKLSFDKNYSLHHYLLISGCPNKNHLGKTFKIIKSDVNSSFFKKLHQLISKNRKISLIKHTTDKGDVFWTKVSFNLINEHQVNFNLDKDIFSDKQEIILTKLFDILDSLESNLGVATSEKYLIGYLEEKGVKTFDEYVNQIHC